ncbi:MAG TPA: hypothetical protein PK607_15160 [Aggregatilineales bacterium]|nr:hypothetical protein [Aggregatilineales bacterium]
MPDAALSATRVSTPLRWLAGSLRVHLLNADQLPKGGAVFAVQRPYDGIAHAVYERHLPGRAGLLRLDAAPLAGFTSPGLEEGMDVLIPLDAEPGRARQQLTDILSLARSTARPIFPLGVAAGPTLALGGDSLPLPRARVVMIIEAPFHVPGQPQRIPSDWPDALARLLKQANGRARDILATWKHTGQPPED